MRYLWVDSPDNPAYEKAAAAGVDGFFFDPRVPRVTKMYLEVVASLGKAVGIYAGAGWGELGSSPEEYVARAKGWLVPLRKSNEFPKFQWDIELHDPEFVLRVMQLWRKEFPWQATSWTLESMQGGWMDTEAFVKPMLACRVRVVPQYYGGAMEPFAPDVALKDLLARGWPANVVSGFYDAARLPLWWDGYAFTQGRLP